MYIYNLCLCMILDAKWPVSHLARVVLSLIQRSEVLGHLEHTRGDIMFKLN